MNTKIYIQRDMAYILSSSHKSYYGANNRMTDTAFLGRVGET